MDPKYIFGMFAIGSIVTLETVAMFKGINGQGFATAIAAVVAISAGVIGYAIGRKEDK